jgi:HK97 family phage prohead protease
MKHLHEKILEAKRRAPYMMRSSAVAPMEIHKPEDFLALLDKRIVRGYSSLWSSKNSYDEIFIKGAYAKSIDERGPKSNASQQIKFLRQHNQSDPLSLFEEIEEDETGLKFRTKPLDPIDSADRVLIQIRSGTLNNYSNGFLPVWDKAEYDEKSNTIFYTEVKLFEISTATLASDSESFTIRSLKEFTEEELNLGDEIEYYIKSLKREQQLEARNLFARQKTLYEMKPQTALPNQEPPKAALNLDYLLQNF